jgi:hypothetical protein
MSLQTDRGAPIEGLWITATRLVRGLLRRIPVGIQFLEAYDLTLVGCNCPGVHHPGEYQSPIPSLSRIKAQRHRTFDIPKELPGVDLNLAGQRALGMEIAPFVAGCLFPQTKTPPWRYSGENAWFSWADAVVLHGLMRHFRPARAVKVGSGFSSAVTLDTVEHCLSGSCHCTFVGPHPERLWSLGERMVVFRRELRTVRGTNARSLAELRQNPQDISISSESCERGKAKVVWDRGGWELLDRFPRATRWLSQRRVWD